MRDHAIANLEIAWSANGADDASRFHAQRHRGPYPKVPVTSPHEVVPMTDAGDMNVDEQLSRPWIGGLSQLEELDWTVERFDPRSIHGGQVRCRP